MHAKMGNSEDKSRLTAADRRRIIYKFQELEASKQKNTPSAIHRWACSDDVQQLF